MIRPAPVRVRLPRSLAGVPSRGEFDSAMTSIEDAMSPMLRSGTTVAVAGLILTAPGGGSFAVTVDDAGVLHVAPVART